MLNQRTLLLCMAGVSVSACTTAQCIDAPRLEWVGTNGTAGGQEGDDPTRFAIAVNGVYDVAMAGLFHETCDLDPTDRVQVFTPAGSDDGTFSINSSDGAESRVFTLGGGLAEAIEGGVAMSNGSLVYAGVVEQQWGEPGYCVDFNLFQGDDWQCIQGDAHGLEIFVTRIGADEEYHWTALLGGLGLDFCNDVKVSPRGTVFVTGGFTGIGDFDPGPGEFLLTEHGKFGYRDAFLVCLDPAGHLLWAVGIGGNSTDEGEKLATDLDGNIYWLGRFAESVDFDPGPGEDIRISQSVSDMFVCKYTRDGEYLWTRTLDTKESHAGCTIETFDDGRLMIGGEFKDRVDFDPTEGVDQRRAAGDADAFVSMWTTDGDYLWTLTWGSGGYDSADAAFDGNGDIILAGGFHTSVDFDPGPGEDLRTSYGDFDAYVGKLTRDGGYQWVRTFGGPSEDSVMHLAVNRDNGDIWLDGVFRGTVDFDPGPGEALRTTVGERDLFLMKMTCDGRGCEELTGHSATGGTGSVESRVSTTVPGGKSVIKIAGDAASTKKKARLVADGSGSTTFRDLPPGRYRVTVAKLKTAEGTRVCNGQLMERFVEVQ